MPRTLIETLIILKQTVGIEMNNISEFLFQLMKVALGNVDSVRIPSNINWKELMEFAEIQGISFVAFDGLQKVLADSAVDNSSIISMDELMEWVGQTNRAEIAYKQYTSTLYKLVDLLTKHDIKVMVLKGYGCSLNYPIPEHRPCGDIDIFLYGNGAKADALFAVELGIKSKQNEEKHSVFEFEGITIENHACIINDNRYPSLAKLERILEEDAVNALYCEDINCYLPSIYTDSLYLPYHIANHFVRGEASIRQFVDWFMFVRRNHTKIDWDQVQRTAKDVGFYKFFCCMNGIIIDYLGADSSCFPDWPRDYKLEKKVFDDILTKKDTKDISLFKKVVRFFSSSWKFRLVYNEKILITSFRQARAYALVKWNIGNRNVWEKNKE